MPVLRQANGLTTRQHCDSKHCPYNAVILGGGLGGGERNIHHDRGDLCCMHINKVSRVIYWGALAPLLPPWFLRLCRVLAYYNQTLKCAECKYCITRNELLAVALPEILGHIS